MLQMLGVRWVRVVMVLLGACWALAINLEAQATRSTPREASGLMEQAERGQLKALETAAQRQIKAGLGANVARSAERMVREARTGALNNPKRSRLLLEAAARLVRLPAVRAADPTLASRVGQAMGFVILQIASSDPQTARELAAIARSSGVSGIMVAFEATAPAWAVADVDSDGSSETVETLAETEEAGQSTGTATAA